MYTVTGLPDKDILQKKSMSEVCELINLKDHWRRYEPSHHRQVPNRSGRVERTIIIIITTVRTKS